MAIINVAINFGYEYFCFVIYFFKIFFPKFFFKFFPQDFFFFILSKFFSQLFFKFFFFEGFTVDASPFIETKQTVCIFVMKNMIYSKRSKLDFSLV